MIKRSMHTQNKLDLMAYSARLKEADRDRYLMSFFAPAQHQLAMCGADLFNYEIARVREHVTQPHIGMIRLQWWRDRVAALYAGHAQTAHDIFPCLGQIVREYAIPLEMWLGLIDAREADHVGDPIATVDEFARYAQQTHAPLLRIKLQLQGSEVPDEIVNSVARIYAMVGLVRAAPFHAGGGRVYLPALAVSSITPHNEKMIAAVKNVCDAIGRDMVTTKTDNRYLKAHLVLARLYLRHIAQCGYDPFHFMPLPCCELKLWWGVNF